MVNNQADDKIKQALTDVCPSREQWVFTKQPHGDCLNRSLRNCLCGHRAIYILISTKSTISYLVYAVLRNILL